HRHQPRHGALGGARRRRARVRPHDRARRRRRHPRRRREPPVSLAAIVFSVIALAASAASVTIVARSDRRLQRAREALDAPQPITRTAKPLPPEAVAELSERLKDELAKEIRSAAPRRTP